LGSDFSGLIIGAKPKDHKWLFDWVNQGFCETLTIRRENKTYNLRWFNNAPLNESNEDVRVNFLECIEIGVDKKGLEGLGKATTFHLDNRHHHHKK
jgi:hypothetical protein